MSDRRSPARDSWSCLEREQQLERIELRVANRYGLTLAQLAKNSREPMIAWPRMVAACLMWLLTDATTRTIAGRFGKHRTWTTHTVRAVQEAASANDLVDRDLATLKTQLTGRTEYDTDTAVTS
jgi:chromosomal replication initiation ATPase DnaA